MNAKEFEKVLVELSNRIDLGIHVVDASGKSIVYNQKMANLEKINREEVIGKPFRKVFSHIPEEESTLMRALKEGKPTMNMRQTYLNMYGKEVTTENSTVPVFDNEGKRIAAIEIAKDITDIQKLSNTILELQSGALNPKKAGPPAIKRYTFTDLVGESREFREVVETAKRAARTNASVFIYGETGTGKELLAQSIHYESDRKGKPFLAQNCAALPESLLEGILFGTAKGGFTGAVDRAGLFEQASGGTLLLDELSAMPYELQSKLLRVLQEDYIRRVGGTRDIPIDVRIIATVNERPEELMQKGLLRKDLYYRISIVNLSIPPLRHRRDDIGILADFFVEKHNRRFGKEIWMINEAAKEKLNAYDYPGNVRELENIIMSAVSLADREHVITEKLISLRESRRIKFRNTGDYDPEKQGIDEYLESLEVAIIKEIMAENGGNISKTADKLGIKRQTLQHKIKRYGI